MKKETADKILRETEAGYDLISEKFSQTRKHFWRGLELLKDYTRAGDKILDFGCGNGRLLELIGDIAGTEYYGTDVSEKLIGIARQKYPEKQFVKTGSGQTTLPFGAEFFNTTYSIAVFHHLPSQKYREEVAKELFRVTKSGGRIIVTAWNLWQKKYLKNILRNWFGKLRALYGGSTSIMEVEPPPSELDWNDCLISFTNNQGKKFERYHHAFTKRELQKLFERAGFNTEKCGIVNGRNILYIGKK